MGKSLYNLIIGIAGPYGSGSTALTEEFKRVIIDWPGSQVEIIHAATLIESSYPHITGKQIRVEEFQQAKMREVRQRAGTDLRKIDLGLIGEIISTEIFRRGRELEENGNLNDVGTIIFVIDSLKNSHDVEALKRIYSDEFYLIYICADEKTRWHRMRYYKGWPEEEKKNFQELDQIDSDEKLYRPDAGEAGQQVRKLSSLADYYIVNNGNRDQLKNNGSRFLELLFGNGNQPTFHERAMHLSFSASNTSQCLSRQVGAAIFDVNGNILGIGRNDVPKANGGLYSAEVANDNRCCLVGDRRCINDINKEERFRKLSEDICRKFPLQNIKEEIYNFIRKSEFREATEYCRAVHAEMEAILSMARSGAGSTIGATMYVTTQPCHNCTKHILCAGIRKVFYIEPYPKSLAEELHSDAILLNPTPGEESEDKLSFVLYQGIAPRRFHDFFMAVDERKDLNGKMISRSKQEKAELPRFSKRLVRRSRLVVDCPDSVTFQEMQVVNKMGEKIKGTAEAMAKGV